MVSNKYSAASVKTISLRTNKDDIISTKVVKTKIKIKYQKIADAANLCDDPTWKQIILDMACGKCPTKFSIRENKHTQYLDLQLIFKGKIKNITIKLPLYDLVLLKDCIINFVKEHSIIESAIDKQHNEEKIQQVIAEVAQANNVKYAKQNKPYKISTFVHNLNITKEDKIKLFNLIQTGIHLKYLNNDDFQCDEAGNIISMKGILYDQITGRFVIDQQRFSGCNQKSNMLNVNINQVFSRQAPSNGVNMLTVWE